MKKPLPQSRLRRDEQQILDLLEVRLIEEHELECFNPLIQTQHYLKSSAIVGRHVRYVAVVKGQ